MNRADAFDKTVVRCCGLAANAASPLTIFDTFPRTTCVEGLRISDPCPGGLGDEFQNPCGGTQRSLVGPQRRRYGVLTEHAPFTRTFAFSAVLV